MILNYNTENETIDCIDSILKNVKEYEIVVVDNCSEDKSGKKLKEKYSDTDHITVLINEDNYGFSKGMNVGYRFLKEEKKCDYICMANSDTVVETSCFEELIKDDFKENDAAVIGPKILIDEPGAIGKNPYLIDKLTPEEKLIQLERAEKFRRRKHFFASLGILGLYEKISKAKKKVLSKQDIEPYYSAQDELVIDTAVNGAFIIFTPNYVEKFDGLEELTFMYGEEWLLYDRCHENNLKIMYDPRIVVKHIGGRATNNKMNYSRSYLKKSKIEHERYIALRHYIMEKYGIK